MFVCLFVLFDEHPIPPLSYPYSAAEKAQIKSELAAAKVDLVAHAVALDQEDAGGAAAAPSMTQQDIQAAFANAQLI